MQGMSCARLLINYMQPYWFWTVMAMELLKVEWNESEGAIKKTYSGFRKRSLGVVQFDTVRNRFLAAGDEFQIKFWDMENTNMIATTEADGGLPASPKLRFNKEGSLLAVTTNDNGIKILGNSDGQRLIRMLESRTFEGSRGPSELINTKPQIVHALGPMANISTSQASNLESSDRLPHSMFISNFVMRSSRTTDVKPRISDDVDNNRNSKLSQILDSSQLKALQLPELKVAGKEF